MLILGILISETKFNTVQNRFILKITAHDKKKTESSKNFTTVNTHHGNNPLLHVFSNESLCKPYH